jgi:hypothetical protein
VVASVAIASTGWVVHRDQSNHFQIATPGQWVIIPGLRSAALSVAASLKKRSKLRQATIVRSYLADNYQSGENRVLDGVQYPIQTSPILTDFLIVKDHLPSGVSSDSRTLSALGDVLFGGLAKERGVHMTTKKPVHLRLHAGEAVSFSGAVLASGFGGALTGFTFYLFLGPQREEWQIEFRTDSRHLAGDAALFRRIAASFGEQ